MFLNKVGCWGLCSLWLLSACAGAPTDSDETDVAVATSALSTRNVNVQMTLPSGLANAAFLVAQTKVQMDSGVNVNGAVWSAGTVTMQPDAKAQSITATGNVVLADRDTVGSITLGGKLTKGNNDTIGSVTYTTLTNVTSSTTVTFPATTQSVTVNAGQTRTLAPGSYVNLNVSSNATLVLSAGDYYVSSLTVESAGNLKLNPAEGATRLFVATSFTYRGKMPSTADASRFLIEYLGTTPLTLETQFQGSLIVPRTSLAIGTANGQTHRGSFMAQSIEVQPNAKMEFVLFNPEGTSSSCAQGSWDPDGNPFTPCVPKTVCAPGSYVSSEGTTTSDRVCTGCSSGQFSSIDNAPSCTDWTNCEAGTYVSNVPSATTDRICLACPDGEYSSGTNQSQCLSQGSCAAGTVQTAPGTATSPAVCTTCAAGEYCAGGTAPAVACGEGTWDNDSDPATQCVAQTTCIAGTYVATEGSATTDRTCAACDSGTFSTAENVASCSDWTTCLAGTYVSNTPSATVDRICSDCPSGEYSSGENQASCLPQGVCAAGTVETEPGTPISPAVCTACDAGSYCAGGSSTAVACAEGTWDNDQDPSTPCVEQTNCAPGSYVFSQGTPTTDRICSPCEEGQFSTATNAEACLAWGNCPAGTYVSNTPSATQDRTCTECPEGQVSGENAPSCTLPNTYTTGAYHTCAIINGGVKCAGWNIFGNLGNGSIDSSQTAHSVPVQVNGLTEGTTALSSGFGHTCAIVDGGVKCWGKNDSGQVGNQTQATGQPEPVDVAGLESGVTALSLGGDRSCAIVDGAAKCWGYNGNGAIGIGGTEPWNVLVPTQVLGLTSGVTAMAGSEHHHCAVVSGAVKCWGQNPNGELGDGTTTDSYVPVQVAGLTSGVTALSAGATISCAIVNGGVMCWGATPEGLIGDDPPLHSELPYSIPGWTSGVTAIAAGRYHVCAVVNGSAQCLGRNGSYVLGDGTSSGQPSPTPVQVAGMTSGVERIDAGYFHTCASTVEGSVMCWGGDFFGQLGDGGNAAPKSSPVAFLMD